MGWTGTTSIAKSNLGLERLEHVLVGRLDRLHVQTAIVNAAAGIAFSRPQSAGA